VKNISYFVVVAFLASSCIKAGEAGLGLSDGRGGSMARFAIVDNMLYTISNSNIKLFDIEEGADPKYYEQRDVQVGFDIETVFPMDTLLFIGSREGMYIYDITDPRFPSFLSKVSHLRSCDPVVAQGNYAYVTLNTKTSACGPGTNNVLDIYDISDISVPVLKKTLFMSLPMGLGIDGTKLFVCDRGLKVFDISDPVTIRQVDDLVPVGEVNILEAYDVIPVDGLLLLVAKEGLFQFDYTGDRLQYVSKIAIKQ